MIVVEFDPAKDAKNRRKHGIGLAAAAVLLEGPILRHRDNRLDHGEDRWIGVGLISGRTFAACFTMRG